MSGTRTPKIVNSTMNHVHSAQRKRNSPQKDPVDYACGTVAPSDLWPDEVKFYNRQNMRLNKLNAMKQNISPPQDSAAAIANNVPKDVSTEIAHERREALKEATERLDRRPVYIKTEHEHFSAVYYQLFEAPVAELA
ncbi:hypothetical protein D9619_005012 [Psilocybe cf. subviscida]|uniref:Uncharacterized protein n=1 Tax=Psilocybe cf. subviscida TaxID=2480587 RepID=A0A8H5F8J2_9AGAR|nr:hypothetical protein D9619_005012 [Psilocybe cf. subviscida]